MLAYVINAGWVDGNAADGMRKALAEEFSSIYVFHLRGKELRSAVTELQRLLYTG